MQLEIEERRRVERELREARERYRLLAEHLPGVAYVWDLRAAHDEPVYVSPQIEGILGYTSTEWGRADFWRTRIHPDDRRDVSRRALRSSVTGEPFSLEYRYLAKDGSVVWVLDQAILLERDERGRPTVFHGLMLDITDRKAAEAKASETERRYQSLAAQIPAITYIWSPSTDTASLGVTEYISEQVQSVLGFTPEEWVANADFWIGRLHPDDRDRVLESANRVLPRGEPFSLQYRLIASDGSVVWIRDEGRVVARDEHGRPLEWQGLMLDVTEHERGQQEQRDADRRLRELVEQMPAIVYIELPTSDATESRLVYLSPQVESILGYTPEELIAEPRHFVRLLHPDDRERIVAANARSDATGDPFDEEYRVVTKDGSTVWIHSRAALVRHDDGRPLYWHGVALDVSARRAEVVPPRRTARAGASPARSSDLVPDRPAPR
jgi:PAS domain S-box-containing protein